MSELVMLDAAGVANLLKLAGDSIGMSRTRGALRVGPWMWVCSGRVMVRAADCDGEIAVVVVGVFPCGSEFDWSAYAFDVGGSGTTLENGAAKTAEEAFSSANAWMRNLFVSAIGKASGRGAKRQLASVLRDMDRDKRVVQLFDAGGPSDG